MTFDESYFDRVIDRKNTGCEKWDDPQVLPEGGIPLWVADMDFPCAPAIIEALQKRAQHPCFGYNVSDAQDEEALRGYWLRRHQVQIQGGESVMLPCVITGLKMCVRAFSKPGAPVAIVTPVYGPFYEAIKTNGRVVKAVPLIRDEETLRYHLDLEGLKAALRDGAQLLMLCSPHNPVSRLWSREELEAVLRLAEEFNVPVVCDEIHADFVYKPGVFTSMLSLPGSEKRVVALCSASKTFNVAGLQQAALICRNEEMRNRLREEIISCGVVSGNTFALAAARAAYTQCDDWLDGLIRYLDASRKLVEELVAQYLPKARMTPVESTYLAWLDLRAYGFSCQELSEKFKAGGVALTGGSFFGKEGEGFMRLNFACPREMLKEGVKRMGAVLEVV